MFSSPRSVYAIVVLVALVPGAISWWSGSRLARRVNDGALPELLFEHRRRNGVMFGLLIGAIGWFAVESTSHIAPPLALGGLVAYGGLIAAGYPLRRALYQDRWSFATYCLFYPRVTIGLFGFWLLLASLPGFVTLGGDRGWLVAIALGIALVAWNRRKAEIVRWTFRTQPLGDGDLLDGCRALAIASGFPETRFERIDLQGGVVANALALPAVRHSSVLFTDTVLERFDRREILAICAHELAHFEHYTPARVRRFDRENDALVALGVLAALGATVSGMNWGPSVWILWLVLIIATLAMRARGKQQQETHCDLRAAELTGDADGVIRGLTKLYTIARMPRRLAQQTEQAATHPSLARRIRDIRKAASLLPTSLPSARTFSSSDDRTVVTFDDDSVRWVERDAVTHVLSYGHLTELRVVTKPGRGPRLAAIGAEARRWEMALRPSDVGPIQEVLDAVDGKLADPPRAHALPLGVRRMIVISSAVLVFAFSQIAVGLITLLAWVKPTAPLLAAAGLAAEAAAAIAFRDATGSESLIALSLPLAATGLVLLGLAWSQREAPRQGMRPFMTILGAAALFAVVAVLTNGVDAVRLHRTARAVPSAAVILSALGGALFCSRIRTVRIGGLTAVALAHVMGVLGSTTFLDRFATDPLVVDAPMLRWVALTSSPIQAFDVPFDPSWIALSQDGRYVALHRDVDEDDNHQSVVKLGRVGDTLASIEADDVAFVNDGQVLLVRSDADGTRLETRRLAAAADIVWQRRIENLSGSSLSLDRARREWRLLGWENEEFIVRVRGLLGGVAVEQQRWPWGEGNDLYVSAMTSAEGEAFVIETRYDRNLIARALPWRWSWAQTLLPVSEVARYGAVDGNGLHTLGESELDLDCPTHNMPDAALACAAYDGSRTRIVSISAPTGRVDGVGMLDGHFVSNGSSGNGWLTGWARRRPVAIRLATGEIHYIPHGRVVRLLPAAEDRLVAIVSVGDHLSAVVYATESDSNTEETVAERGSRHIPSSLR